MAKAGSSGFDPKAIIAPVKAAMSAVKEAITGTFDFIKQTVGALRPYQIERFNRAVADTQAVIGEVLEPVFNSLIDTVRAFADYLYNLPSGFKEIIKLVAEWIMQLGALGGIIKLINSSAEGQALIKNVVDTFHSLIQTAIELGGVIKRALTPAWNDLKSELMLVWRDLNNMLNELKPVLGVALITGVKIAVAELKTLAGVLQMTAKLIRFFAAEVIAIAKVINHFTGANKNDYKFEAPEMGNTSSFGKAAWNDAGVSDPISVYRAIQDRALKSTGTADRPENKTAQNTGEIASKTEQLLQETRKQNGFLQALFSKDAALAAAFPMLALRR